MDENIIKQIVATIERSQKIIVMPSSPPDGDSIGSALAFYLVLQKLGKEVTVVCADSVPDVLDFLPEKDAIRNKFNPSRDFIVTLDSSETEVDNMRYNVEKNKVNIIVTPQSGSFSEKDVSFHYGPSNYDLIITVDTAELQQLGPSYENNIDFFYNTPLINIDHHASNEHFGTINHVDVTAAAATELLLPIFEHLEKDEPLIDADIATLLLAGIITDTGSFQNANTTPKSFAVAAKLLGLGARQQEIIKHVYKTKELSTLRLWGLVLSNLSFDKKRKIVWSSISLQDFTETESSPEDTGGIIDELLSNAPGAEVILLMKEKKEGLVSCSLRSTTPQVNVSDLAAHFGGGGHPMAAGFRIKDKSLEAAKQEVLAFLQAQQEARLGQSEATPKEGSIEALQQKEEAFLSESKKEQKIPYNNAEKILRDALVKAAKEKKTETKEEKSPEKAPKEEPKKESENPLETMVESGEEKKEQEGAVLEKLFYEFDQDKKEETTEPEESTDQQAS